MAVRLISNRFFSNRCVLCSTSYFIAFFHQTLQSLQHVLFYCVFFANAAVFAARFILSLFSANADIVFEVCLISNRFFSKRCVFCSTSYFIPFFQQAAQSLQHAYFIPAVVFAVNSSYFIPVFFFSQRCTVFVARLMLFRFFSVRTVIFGVRLILCCFYYIILLYAPEIEDRRAWCFCTVCHSAIP